MTNTHPRTYSVTRDGSRWLLWSKAPGKYPIVFSEHRTESAANKMRARVEAESSANELPKE
jgi:hypothetical protein